MRFATRAIHDGQEPDELTGAVTVPVYLTSTYKQDAVGKTRGGYEYSRTGNPSRTSLETTIASLENGKHGLCFSSGSAATAAVLNLLKPGDEVLTTIDIYGGTYRLFRKVYAKYGIDFTFMATSDADEISDKMSPKTRMIWIETPTNPLLNVLDIAKLASAKEGDVLLVVDNTFASPYFQNPLDLGADIVAHSTTKYLGGHSDVIGGALVTDNDELHQACKFYQNAAGATPSAFDCFLTQRGIKTLEVRMLRHQSNAYKIAEFLKGHRRVEQVFFPGLPEHPNHDVVKKQMRGQSGMVSFKLRGGKAEAGEFYKKLKVFLLAESLGGVESLTCYPYTMTHLGIPDEEKQRIGITENLLRLSVGIEAVEDLLEDLDQALG